MRLTLEKKLDFRFRISDPLVPSFVCADLAGVEAGVEVADAGVAGATLAGVEVAAVGPAAVLAGVAGAAGLEMSLGGVGGDSTLRLLAGASGRATVSPEGRLLFGVGVALP